MSYLIALDQGTTSSRALLLDPQGKILSTAQREFEQVFPQPGWVEHDPWQIWKTQSDVLQSVVDQQRASPAELAAIGVTNQRETTVIWDRESGEPVYNAIVWQDRRTAPRCDEIRESGFDATVREKTGLIPDSYFSATKIEWILNHVPGVRARAEAGKLAFGTIDSWLIWNLTGGREHVTDASNASRTMLLNIHSGEWDRELLRWFDIPESLLPRVVSSSGVCGVARRPQSVDGVSISGIAGDQQAALFGQGCTAPGSVKNTYGTGCFLLMNTGRTAVTSQHKLLTTIAWKTDSEIHYALEGSSFAAGATVQWLRDGLQIVGSSGKIEALARTVEDNGGVYFVPAFSGLGAPHWDPYARGLIIGLTRGTTRGHIARAALEGIAFQVNDVLRAMQADCDHPVAKLHVDGGVSANAFLMQFQADLLGVPVLRPPSLETTARGVACLAGLGVGIDSSPETWAQQQEQATVFSPNQARDDVAQLLAQWREAVERSRRWDAPGQGAD